VKILLIALLVWTIFLTSCQAPSPTAIPAQSSPSSGNPALSSPTPAPPSNASASTASPRDVATATAPRAAVNLTPARKSAVVATYSIIGDFVREIGGDVVDLTVLVGADSDAHTFHPSPSDNVSIARADVVFENGLEFEPWLDDMFRASGSAALRVVVTDGMTPIKAGEHGHEGEDNDQDHGEFDPHVWHDVNLAMHMVEAVRDGLLQADPANSATYQANATRYLNELRELDRWVVESVQSLPERRRTLVTAHDTFGYFAARYGFVVIGTAVGASTEAAEPSAGEIARLVRRIRSSGVPVIFAENVSQQRIMDQIARESGVRLGPPLYTDALGANGSPGDTYVKMMRYNVSSIVNSLKE
jgi:zinc/manganese transport system substrate-binding protein